jgi:rubrerythrin
MADLKTIDDVLTLAIGREAAAVEFYTGLAKSASRPAMVEVFEKFAREERGHEARLKKVQSNPDTLAVRKAPVSLSFADYLVDIEPTPGMSYDQAIIIAMKREDAAHRLYKDMAGQVSDPDMIKLFEWLATEEAKHRHRFEVEYDEEVLREN